MSSVDVFERTVRLLQKVALGHAAWPEAACLVGRATRTRGSALSFGNGYSQSDAEIFHAELCLGREPRQDLLCKYFEDYWARDERIPGLSRLPHGQLVHTGEMYTDREKKTSPAYNEALRDFEAQNGLHMRLDGPEGSHIAWIAADSTERGGLGGRSSRDDRTSSAACASVRDRAPGACRSRSAGCVTRRVA